MSADIQQVRRDAPWSWLRAGWADMMRAPVLSIGYGLVFVAIGVLVTAGLWAAGWGAFAPVAFGGFALVAPAFAIGIYQISRAFDRGEAPRIRLDVSRFPERRSQIALASVLLLFLFLVWSRIAQFLLVAIAPDELVQPGPFMEFILSEPAGIVLLALGTAIGAIIAFIAFAASALTFPMLVDRDVDVVTAMGASFRAVVRQPFVMLTWAWLLAFMTMVGIATFGIGLAITFPWMAHASWRAYQDFAGSSADVSGAAASA